MKKSEQDYINKQLDKMNAANKVFNENMPNYGPIGKRVFIQARKEYLEEIKNKLRNEERRRKEGI